MARLIRAKTRKNSVPKIRVIPGIQTTPLFKNRDFLYEKYVEKQWSTNQIAAEMLRGAFIGF